MNKEKECFIELNDLRKMENEMNNSVSVRSANSAHTSEMRENLCDVVIFRDFLCTAVGKRLPSTRRNIINTKDYRRYYRGQTYISRPLVYDKKNNEIRLCEESVDESMKIGRICVSKHDIRMLFPNLKYAHADYIVRIADNVIDDYLKIYNSQLNINDEE